MLAGIRHWQAARAFKAVPRNDAWPELEIESFESFIRDKIGSILSPDALDQNGAEIRKLLQNPNAFQHNIGEIRREWVFNYGTSAVAAATAIQEMLARAHARCSTTGDST
jgi:hypothetical protein